MAHITKGLLPPQTARNRGPGNGFHTMLSKRRTQAQLHGSLDSATAGNLTSIPAVAAKGAHTKVSGNPSIRTVVSTVVIGAASLMIPKLGHFRTIA